MENNNAYTGVWVFCEQYGGKLRAVGLELLAEGRKLADELQTTLTAVICGAEAYSHGPRLISHGADVVLAVEHAALAELNDITYTAALAELVEQYRPSILLLGATSFGRSFAPRLAARLSTGLTADCTSLAADCAQGLLLQTRPAFGGNLFATIITPQHRPQMATVRPKVFSPLPADASRTGKITRVAANINSNDGVMLLESLRGAGDAVNIGDADILIAVGRGIGSAKNIALAEELARLLNGAVAVSRPLVDSGWYGYQHQVGQTGKTVMPKLYLACGISGAVQHVAGVAAETVVAVNSDADAPIFAHAHYAVRGDCVEFLEHMIELVKERKYRAV